jgi:hypothetical protein
VCGNFWRVDQIQNGERCHGNQGAKIVFVFTSTEKHTWPLKNLLGT